VASSSTERKRQDVLLVIVIRIAIVLTSLIKDGAASAQYLSSLAVIRIIPIAMKKNNNEKIRVIIMIIIITISLNVLRKRWEAAVDGLCRATLETRTQHSLASTSPVD